MNKQFVTLLFFTFVCIILTSCTHVKRHDGPPNYDVDETKIPNAVPRHERLAKYGNMHSYVVFGKRYHTMKSAKHYEAVGTASWYGTLFHSRRTSSGEEYDMLAMTAAHKTLPLPTYVEVTNLKNHRKIIVKVNDRGPFESNRLIDLSYVAAKKLGMLGHGTTMVKVKAIDPSTWREPSDFWIADSTNTNRVPVKRTYSYYLENNLPLSSKPRSTKKLATTHTYTHTVNPKTSRMLADEIPVEYYRSVSNKHFKTRAKNKAVFASNKTNMKHSIKSSTRHSMYLQVGAFKQKTNALKLQKRLTAMLDTPVILLPSSKSKLYHVRVGPIKDVSLAKHLTSKLKVLGIKSNKIGA